MVLKGGTIFSPVFTYERTEVQRVKEPEPLAGEGRTDSSSNTKNLHFSHSPQRPKKDKLNNQPCCCFETMVFASWSCRCVHTFSRTGNQDSLQLCALLSLRSKDRTREGWGLHGQAAAKSLNNRPLWAARAARHASTYSNPSYG